MTRYPLPIFVQRFFTERLTNQLAASANTVASYRDTFRLLLTFATDRLGRQPTDLLITDIDADLVGRFLNFVETSRGNSARSRNTRLAGRSGRSSTTSPSMSRSSCIIVSGCSLCRRSATRSA